MVKTGVKIGIGLIIAGGFFGRWVTTAEAIKAFQEVFIAKYVKPSSQNPKDRAFREAVEAAGCNVCHCGLSKKQRIPTEPLCPSS